MDTDGNRTYTAFAGHTIIASGALKEMLVETKRYLDGASGRPPGEDGPLLIFEDQTGAQIDFDLRGSAQEALARLASHPMFESDEAQGQLRLGPGRPKLGVVCREVSLLPRHWSWLDEQPGGSSAALRRLVEEAKRRRQGKQLAQSAREAAGKLMWALAGDLAHFEEASRALFARDDKRLKQLIEDWPTDIRKHVERLVKESVRLEKQAVES